MSKKIRDKKRSDSFLSPESEAANPWVKIAPFLIIALIAILYSNSLSGAFILDDHVSIRQNMSIRRLFPFRIPLSPPENTSVSGRPILNFTFALNYAISGVSTWSYHVFNIVIHIIAALFLYGVIRRALVSPRLKESYRDKAEPLALICVLIWAAHPIQTESVTYVIQRAESFAGLFYLAALYCAIRGATKDASRFWGGAAVLCCVLGMGTKEMVATAPVVILFYDYFFLTGSFRKALSQRPFFYIALGCSWLFLPLFALGARTGSAGFGITGYGPIPYALTQLGVITHYLRLCFYPHPLVIDYLWFLERNPVNIILPGILIGVLLFLTGLAIFRKFPAGFAGVWFFLILAPTSSVMPIPTEIAAERRMYLPLAAVAVLAVLLAYRSMEKLSAIRLSIRRNKKTISALIVIFCITIFSFLTIRRNRDYHDPEKMWKLVIKERPRNCRAFFNLGLFYIEQNRKDEAITQLSNAVECKHESIDISELHYILAKLLTEKGRHEEARVNFEEAIAIAPDNVNVLVDFGISLAGDNQLDRAENAFREALFLQPDNGLIHYNLGNVLELRGNLDEAVNRYEDSIRLNPEFPEPYRNLGELLERRGDPDGALRYFKKALTLRRDWGDVLNAIARIERQ